MRIAHISDLHLSNDNLQSFNEFYFEALLKDLKKWNSTRKIDLIFLTGDLVDKAGKSLSTSHPYKLVEEVFIDKLVNGLQLSKDKFIILSGNHDVDITAIKPVSEKGLLSLEDIFSVNKYVDEYRNNWHEGIIRIEKYKEFEKEFYTNAYADSGNNDTNYYVSNFESCFIFPVDNLNVGVAAFNSAWRCSPQLLNNKLFLGTSQILKAKNFFQNRTDFNIALIHHPIEFFCEFERQEIISFLSNLGFQILLCGHTHSALLGSLQGINGNFFFSIAKSAFNNPREPYDKYIPGYAIMDFNVLSNGEVEILSHFRKYIHNRISFDKDVDSSEDGFYKIILPNKIQLPLGFVSKYKTSNNEQPIIDAWNKVTDVLIESAYPAISVKMGELIKQYMFPEKFELYYKDLIISYEIKKIDDNHFYLKENQSYKIISSKRPFNLELYDYIEKRNTASDKSDINLTEFIIDGVDCNKEEFVTTVIKDIGDIVQKGILLKKTLSEKTIYKVRKTTESIHSLKLNGIWKYDINYITENLSLTIRNFDNFEIDLIKFGNSAKNFMESSPYLDTQVMTYENLLMPGEGFILIIKLKDQN